MTLLLTVFAAVVSTVVWYFTSEKRDMKLMTLCQIYWGASLMWFVDAVAEYLKEGPAYFQPEMQDVLNDAFLGLSVIALGAVIWMIYFLASDPLGIIRKKLVK